MCYMDQCVLYGPVCAIWTSVCYMDQYVPYGPVCAIWISVYYVCIWTSVCYVYGLVCVVVRGGGEG